SSLLIIPKYKRGPMVVNLTAIARFDTENGAQALGNRNCFICVPVTARRIEFLHTARNCDCMRYRATDAKPALRVASVKTRPTMATQQMRGTKSNAADGVWLRERKRLRRIEFVWLEHGPPPFSANRSLTPGGAGSQSEVRGQHIEFWEEGCG